MLKVPFPLSFRSMSHSQSDSSKCFFSNEFLDFLQQKNNIKGLFLFLPDNHNKTIPIEDIGSVISCNTEDRLFLQISYSLGTHS